MLITFFERTLHNILNAYGVPGISFSSDSNFLQTRSGRAGGSSDNPAPTDQMDVIKTHGCWCSKPFTGSALQGQSLDPVDSVCKEFSQCARCNTLKGCSGSENFTLSVVPLTDSYTCDSLTSCGMDRCHCSASFGVNLARALIDQNSEVDPAFQNADSGFCLRKSSATGLPKDSCCGNAPFGQLFSSLVEVCDAGVLKGL